MAKLDEAFNAEEHPDEFELLPAGVYLAQVIDSEIGDTKAGNGKILKITLEILEGAYATRLLWERLNIRNQNPQAQSISLKQLAKLANACGVPTFDDTEELHYKPILIRLGVREDKTGQYKPQNIIQGYEAAGAATQAAPAGKPEPETAKTAPPAAATGGAPWRKNKAA
jgi:hypothetical protein